MPATAEQLRQAAHPHLMPGTREMVFAGQIQLQEQREQRLQQCRRRAAVRPHADVGRDSRTSQRDPRDGAAARVPGIAGPRERTGRPTDSADMHCRGEKEDRRCFRGKRDHSRVCGCAPLYIARYNNILNCIRVFMALAQFAARRE